MRGSSLYSPYDLSIVSVNLLLSLNKVQNFKYVNRDLASVLVLCSVKHQVSRVWLPKDGMTLVFRII